MRTFEEIAARCSKPTSLLGFDADALLGFLPFEYAKSLLKPETDGAAWDAQLPPLTRDAVLAEMRSYMEFAWGKVDDHRGISASRSVEKMEAWLWLLGEDDLLREVEAAGYAQYGAPKLKLICERLSFPIPDDEDIRRMSRGERCTADYGCGCGA